MIKPEFRKEAHRLLTNAASPCWGCEMDNTDLIRRLRKIGGDHRIVEGKNGQK